VVELIVWLVMTFCDTGGPRPASRQEQFAHTVQPILTRRCQPCHFEGGKMYARLPFDKAETVDKLGTKLFTRIKDEADRTVIRAFLDSQSNVQASSNVRRGARG
jgi:hypothetical protein